MVLFAAEAALATRNTETLSFQLVIHSKQSFVPNDVAAKAATDRGASATGLQELPKLLPAWRLSDKELAHGTTFRVEDVRSMPAWAGKSSACA